MGIHRVLSTVSRWARPSMAPGWACLTLALAGLAGDGYAQSYPPRLRWSGTDPVTREALTPGKTPAPWEQPAPPVVTPAAAQLPAPQSVFAQTTAQAPQPVQPPPPPPAFPTDVAPPAPGTPAAPSGTSEDTAVPGADLPSGAEPPAAGAGDNFPFTVSYRYNPGGGYTHLGTTDDEFTLNFQQQVTLDGTFYDRANVATTEKGFNIPFYRAFAFGNITKDWDYQASVQAFLGSFNILDLWLNHKFCDEVNFKFGRQLTPFLYEYYAFSPAWEPVITNSPLFQIAGKRQLGGSLWGKLFENRAQYQVGVFNGVSGGFFDLNNTVDFIGAFDVTPFKGSGMKALESLGGGVGVQTGRQNAPLFAGAALNFQNGAGEPTLNPVYVGSTGIPFLIYNPGVAMNGMQTKVAPHFYWFGRFSVLAEYVYMDRTLSSDTVARGISTVQGYYVNTSYFLTGESYSGDGLGGYTTITPLRPFIPSKHCYGPGAWELAAQYSQLHIGSADFLNGFVDPAVNASQLSQLMVGVNWWMNKYTRVSFDWVNARTNKAVPISVGAAPTNQYNIFWTRLAMFF